MIPISYMSTGIKIVDAAFGMSSGLEKQPFRLLDSLRQS